MPPEVTATQFGQEAVKALPFQHAEAPPSFWIETFTAPMPWPPVAESVAVPWTALGHPAAL